MNSRRIVHSGFAIIEALVVVLVIAIGLLALAAFHRDLMASSGLVKARAEAMMLARAKLEELSNNIAYQQFTASVPDTSGTGFSTPETRVGKNAVFSRSWRIEDLDSASTTFKKLLVRVVWADPRAIDGRVFAQNISVSGQTANQQVLLNDMLSFRDPAAIGVLVPPAPGSGGNLGINPKRSGIKGPQPGQPVTMGVPAQVLPLPSYVPAGSFYWDFNGEGNVVLLDSTGKVLYTFFGQSIQSISGKVYYDAADFSGVAVFASEPAYCASFPIGTETCPRRNCPQGQTCEPSICAIVGGYVCFFSGDCEHGGSGCGTYNPNGANDFRDVNDLDGGWYGKVGVAGVPHQRAVCQADIDDDAGTKEHAREYVAVRDLGGGAKKYEGINQSFSCQNFIIGAMNENQELNTCTELLNNYSATPPDTGIGLPPSRVRRYLATNTANAALALKGFWCRSLNVVIDNNRRVGLIAGASVTSGTPAVDGTWPEDECVVWEDSGGFTCSVPSGSPNWIGTISAVCREGGTASIIDFRSVPPEYASTKLEKDICD